MLDTSPQSKAGELGAVRVLLVHNAYRQRGGEDVVVEREIALLRGHGHAVEAYARHSDEIPGMTRASLAMETVWSRRAAMDVARHIAAFGPDIVHVHNTFPLISPSVFWAARRAGVPVVQTLHNFRLLCVQAMLLRDGRGCQDCVGRLPWRGIAHRCYRGSAAQSSVIAGMIGVHRAIGTYRKRVTRYIALSDFARARFLEGGFPAARVLVKPNFVDVPRRAAAQRSGGLFVGRLSPEKGVALLVDAVARSPGVTVRVLGDGPEAPRLQGHAGIVALGVQDRDETLSEMHRAAYLVLPSICYENFPLTLVEAFACGLPVIASRLGAMAELIEHGRTGLLFEPGSVDDLVRTIQWAEANPGALRQMGENARLRYEARYTPATNYRQLMAIYADAIAAVGASRQAALRR